VLAPVAALLSLTLPLQAELLSGAVKPKSADVVSKPFIVPRVLCKMFAQASFNTSEFKDVDSGN
jgi:hypothetical protein